MGTTKLGLYNKALNMAGERALDTVDENVEARRLLDVVWDNGGVDECISEGQWNFAMRSVKIDYDPAVEPDFGFNRAFTKPSDHILTSAFCSDEFFRAPHLQYVDEQDFWYCELDEIYVRYISNDSEFGGDRGGWPAMFTKFVAAHFASEIILKLTGDADKLKLFVNPDDPKKSIRGRALLDAKSRNAMSNPSQSMAQGKWSSSRLRGGARRDGGSLSNLIG
jgi:hypothetical protein